MKLEKITKPPATHKRTYEDACGAAHALDLVGDDSRGTNDRSAPGDRSAAGKGAGAERGPLSVAFDHRDVGDAQAEFFRRDLRKRGQVPLALGGMADADDGLTICFDFDFGAVDAGNSQDAA